MKRIYETIIIFDLTLDEAALGQRIQKVEGIIKANDGEILALEKWGRRSFAYEINKKKEGYYLYIRHNSETTVDAQLKNMFQFDESVIRAMTVQVEEVKKSKFGKKKGETKPKAAETSETAAAPAPVEAEAPKGE